MWCVWQPQRNLLSNSYFISRPTGNVLINPVTFSNADYDEIARRGGLNWIAITNGDNKRDAIMCAKHFGAKIAAGEANALKLPIEDVYVLRGGDEFCGARVIELRGLKAAGDFALHFGDLEAVVVGDVLWGDPAGSLRLAPEEQFSDPHAALLSLRRLRARRPRHILVANGIPIFNNAFETLSSYVDARSEIYMQRVNVDELEFVYGKEAQDFGVSRDAPPYDGGWAEVGYLLGATKLGYAAAFLKPGQALCPLHWHTAEEELCVVLDGTATVRTLHGDFALRRGDLISFPARQDGAHKLLNDGVSPCILLLVANADSKDVTFYPDSRKIYVDAVGAMVRDGPQLDYFDGELVKDPLDS